MGSNDFHPEGNCSPGWPGARLPSTEVARGILGNTTQGDQGWLAPMRPQLLPALPPSGAPIPYDRLGDGAPRLPLHPPNRTTGAHLSGAGAHSKGSTEPTVRLPAIPITRPLLDGE